MKKIALLYSSKGGNVESVAMKIKEKLSDFQVYFSDFKDIDDNELINSDFFIIGCSTVGFETWQDAGKIDNWSLAFTKLKSTDLDFSEKKFAIFGLGDHVMYPANFSDNMMMIKIDMESLGCKLIGKWSGEEYTFTDSKAFDGKFFVGLPLDEDNESDLTDNRINRWLAEIEKSID